MSHWYVQSLFVDISKLPLEYVHWVADNGSEFIEAHFVFFCNFIVSITLNESTLISDFSIINIEAVK